MTKNTFHALQLAIVLMASGPLASGATSGMVDPNADIHQQQSHNHPIELNVDARATYNDKFMALMDSPCRPELDGFFGATFGEPVKVSYGFHIETKPLSPIMNILDIVEDKVVDNILSNSFPQACGFRRRTRKLDGHAASGFRFFKFQEVEKCDPEGDQMNFCGVFAGQVNVFGNEKEEATIHVAEMIREALSPSDPTVLHSDIVTMDVDSQYFNVDGNSMNLEKALNRSMTAWIGMVVVGAIFFFMVWWFFIRGDKQSDTGISSSRTQRNRRMWNRSYRRGQEAAVDDMSYDPEEKSIGPHYRDDSESISSSYRDGDRLLLTDGRPVYLDHDTTAVDYEDALEPENKLI